MVKNIFEYVHLNAHTFDAVFFHECTPYTNGHIFSMTYKYRFKRYAKHWMFNLARAKRVYSDGDISNSTSRSAANAGAEKRHYLKGVKPGTSVCVFSKEGLTTLTLSSI